MHKKNKALTYDFFSRIIFQNIILEERLLNCGPLHSLPFNRVSKPVSQTRDHFSFFLPNKSKNPKVDRMHSFSIYNCNSYDANHRK